MSSGRSERTKYPLGELPPQDYHRQFQGPPISRRALTTTTEEAPHESLAATLEGSEATQGEMNMITEMDRLATFMTQQNALMAQLAQHREDSRRE